MKPSLFLLSLGLVLGAAAPLKRRCTFVDDGFVTKDCGYAPTEEEFAEFLANQAAEVAELARTHPCGFTSCSRRFKRDVDFRYSLPDQPVVRKLEAELPLRSSPPPDSDSGRAELVNSSQIVDPSSVQRHEPSVSEFVTNRKDVSQLSDEHIIEPGKKMPSETQDADVQRQDGPIAKSQKGPLWSGYETLGFDRDNTAILSYGLQHVFYIVNSDETASSSLERRNILQSGGEGELEKAPEGTGG